jgi:hypothetical protein
MQARRAGEEGETDGLDAHPGLRHGMMNQELLARNEYLAAENCILKAKLQGYCQTLM